MALNDFKTTLTDADIVNKRISDLPNRPSEHGISAEQLKAYFDYIPLTVLAMTRLNGLIDYMKSTSFGSDLQVTSNGVSESIQQFVDDANNFLSRLSTTTNGDGASMIGVEVIEGVLGDDVQSVVESLARLIADYKTLLASDTGATKIGTTKGNNLQTIINAIEGEIDGIKGENPLYTDLATISMHINAIESGIEILNNKIGVSNGLATLDGNGRLVQRIDAGKIDSINGSTIPLSALPPQTKIYNVNVATYSEMLNLTINEVQTGDFVTVDSEISWYQVVDDTKLGTAQAFRKVPTGVIGQAIMSQQYDPTYHGGNSINDAIQSLNTTINGQETRVQTLEEEMPDKASKSTVGTIVLSVEGWGAEDVSQTVAVGGVTASNNIVVSLAQNSTAEEVSASAEAIVRATEQGEGTITFTCMSGKAPAIPLTVSILIVG